MDRFEQAFWSGQSIEELSRAVGQADASMAACFVAAMREWKRRSKASRDPSQATDAIEKVMNVSIAREVERLERRLLVLATVGSAGPLRPVRHRLGHHVELPVDCRLEKHLWRWWRGHCGGAVCHRNRPDRRNSGDYFLQ
jgi:hypothetical protein